MSLFRLNIAEFNATFPSENLAVSGILLERERERERERLTTIPI
jgi:hypothetical protein